MLLLEYELRQGPGPANPFWPWFVRVPDACVSCTDVSFAHATGSARYLLFSRRPEALAPFLEDVLGFRSPGATRWEAEQAGDRVATLRAQWGEPIYPGVDSPMHLATLVFGHEARCSVSIMGETIHHRILVPNGRDPNALWPAFLEEMAKYEAYAAVKLSFKLERVGRLSDFAARPLSSDRVLLAYEAGSLGGHVTPEEVAEAEALLPPMHGLAKRVP